MVSSQSPWTVHKFGGTSLADSDCFRRVADIVQQAPGAHKAVVVSSMAHITNALISLVELARHNDLQYTQTLDAILSQHHDTIRALLPEDQRESIAQILKSDQNELSQILYTVSLVRNYSQATLDWIAGYGELWSARIMTALLNQKGLEAQWLNARDVLVVQAGETSPIVSWEESAQRLQQWRTQNTQKIVVITGFIASLTDGSPTTLGRNGSDFSASIFGALLEADAITIWTDVDGVLSADPRRVEEVVLLDTLSYHEAMELAYFGAKIIHPHTMAPAVQRQIPIWIRNTFQPQCPGTKIQPRTPKPPTEPSQHNERILPVKGFSTIDGMALLNLEGASMIGVPGVASRLFGALREVGVSVVMISQASSEHSICCAIPAAQADLARETVEQAFFHEIHHGKIQHIEISSPCSILAAVGDNMVEQPGVAAQFFGALGKAGINVRAIAQGSSERNISAVIEEKDSTRALRAVHAGFFLSDQTLSVGLIGPGLIGKTFLAQLQREQHRLREQYRIDLRVRGILSSKTMLLDNTGVPLAQWKERFSQSEEAADLDAFVKHVKAEHLPHTVIIDCTASADVASHYHTWLAQGIHVITPNKKANSSATSYFHQLRELNRKRSVHYLYETTVGAGLPVLQTLRDLIQTGDRVLQIEGVLSGTLSYIFNSFGADQPFSQIVRTAKEQGYTEPDPRDDLSGMDVARKVVILARQMGLPLSLEDLSIQNLVPPSLQGEMPVEDFLTQLAQHDDAMAALQQEAEAAGEVLRYVGVVQPDGESCVTLRRYPLSHPFSRIQGADNIIAFRTSRYDHQPLIVQGPGAGPEVTAAGVFSDLLRLASYLGAPS